MRFKKGAFDYIAKPFDIDEALNVINKALQHSQQQGNKTETCIIEQRSPDYW